MCPSTSDAPMHPSIDLTLPSLVNMGETLTLQLLPIAAASIKRVSLFEATCYLLFATCIQVDMRHVPPRPTSCNRLRAV